MTESDSVDPLLSIGVFARRSWLSLKALRLYDRLGLLTPAYVDPLNGRRQYRASQLFTARLIGTLRRLDMPLAKVAEIVSAPGPVGAEMLAEYWAVVERRRVAQRDLVALLQNSLAGGAERFTEFEVRQREVPEQLVLTERQHLQPDELTAWLRWTKRRLIESAGRCGGAVAELFVIFHGAVTADSDGPVEVCVPIRPEHAGDADLSTRRELAHREAYVRVTKAQFELPQILSAYDTVEKWIDRHGTNAIAAPREIHFDIELADAELTDEVCDVAYPIRR